ncbi:hypothetical protein SLS56_011930 [Neofusicoccum ribis]|uniref:Cytochrome P450 n=1 Tax=Neofusicoccum ribis TaxID=45134 RepID=A0ABR3SBA7_9PEZI
MFELVRELLDRRGRLYISRPPAPVTSDILSGGKRIVLMEHGERWRNLRKVMHQLLMASHADEFKPYQDIESRKLLWDYYVAPEKYYLHGARFANSVIFSVVFGRRTSMREQPVQELFSTIEDFMEMQRSPSANLIDSFPTLAKIIPRPLQWYRPHAERVFRKTVKTYETFFDDLEQRLINGQDPRCFAREMNKIAYKYGFDENQRYYCAGTIIEAGSDTTRNQLNIMIAAAAKFPAWVKTAQEELDSVYGDAERLPSFDDWSSLPYIKAVIKESLRWRPNMTAFGAPRVLIEDDAIGPYIFEKGTIFTYNHWGLSHNEAVYKDNEVFRPERYLDADVDDMLKGHFGFGLGRRVCPGYHVGARNMFVAFARILYCYRFEEDPQAPIDDCRIEPQAHDTPPFKIEIIPRSEKHVELIQKECRAAGIAVD